MKLQYIQVITGDSAEVSPCYGCTTGGMLGAVGDTEDRSFMRYRIALHKSEEGFSVSVPGLPGCWSQGDTETDAIENIKAAIQDYLAVVDEQLRDEDVREIEITV